MGDVIHLLPALTDLHREHPDVEVDWLIEESFVEIAGWHPAVGNVIPVATRRWRSFNRQAFREFGQFCNTLRSKEYDVIIDAQGLLKSAFLTRLAKGRKRVGFSGDSIKESPAAWFYQQHISVPRQMHAINRVRRLLAGAFDYVVPDKLDYGVDDLKTPRLKYPQADVASNDVATNFVVTKVATNYVVFLHGTTWDTKHLPETHWQQLRDHALQAGYHVKMAWGSQTEKERAERLAANCSGVEVLERLSLTGLAKVLSQASGVLAVDTGLGHLSAALGVPALSVYGATDAELTGTRGDNQGQLQSQYQCSPCLQKQCRFNVEHGQFPCYQALSSEVIWQALLEQMQP